MPNPSHCPLCYTQLETRRVAPCSECGGNPKELEHFAEGKHTYQDLEVLGFPLTLCNFCMVDFGSFDPTFFGLEEDDKAKVDYSQMKFVRDKIDGEIEKDKYCPSCGYRLEFLKFVSNVRQSQTAK